MQNICIAICTAQCFCTNWFALCGCFSVFGGHLSPLASLGCLHNWWISKDPLAPTTHPPPTPLTPESKSWRNIYFQFHSFLDIMVRGRRHVYLLLCCNQTGRSCDLSQKGLLVKKIKGERKTVFMKISERSTTWFPEGPGEVGEILFRKIRVVVVIVVVTKVDEASRPDAMLDHIIDFSHSKS